jgi:hypothetical protein
MSRDSFRGSRKYQLSRTLEKGTVPMKAMLVICPIVAAAMMGGAAAESLELRFGPDRERGYRSEREFDGKRRDFENRDRANFLGIKHQPMPEDLMPHPDLHQSPPIGLQR